MSATTDRAVTAMVDQLLELPPTDRDAALGRAMTVFRELFARRHPTAPPELIDLAVATFGRRVVERIQAGDA